MKFRSQFLKKADNIGVSRLPSETTSATIIAELARLRVNHNTNPVGPNGNMGGHAPWQVYHDYAISRKPWKNYDPKNDIGVMNNPSNREPRYVDAPISTTEKPVFRVGSLAKRIATIFKDAAVQPGSKTALTGLWNDLLHPNSQDNFPPVMLPAKGNMCPKCHDGLTRRRNRNGETEMICTTCEYGRKGAAQKEEIPEDTRPGGVGDYDFYKADPGTPAGDEEQSFMQQMGIRGALTASFLHQATKYTTQPEYGLRWSEFDKNDRIVTKEKFFPSSELREGFANKVEAKDNFKEFVAWSDPKETEAAPKVDDANNAIGAEWDALDSKGRQEKYRMGNSLITHKPWAELDEKEKVLVVNADRVVKQHTSAQTPVKDPCPKCKGKGKLPFGKGTCPKCGGTGSSSTRFMGYGKGAARRYTTPAQDAEFLHKTREDAFRNWQVGDMVMTYPRVNGEKVPTPSPIAKIESDIITCENGEGMHKTQARKAASKTSATKLDCCGSVTGYHKMNCPVYDKNFNDTVDKLKSLPRRSSAKRASELFWIRVPLNMAGAAAALFYEKGLKDFQVDTENVAEDCYFGFATTQECTAATEWVRSKGFRITSPETEMSKGKAPQPVYSSLKNATSSLTGEHSSIGMTATLLRKKAMAIVRCRVSGGVTGTREGTLKGKDGKVQRFHSLEQAQQKATELMEHANGPNATANFQYWAEELEEGSSHNAAASQKTDWSKPHCENCGRQNPQMNDGYTTCCNETMCPGINPKMPFFRGYRFGNEKVNVRACCWAHAEEIFAEKGIKIPSDASKLFDR